MKTAAHSLYLAAAAAWAIGCGGSNGPSGFVNRALGDQAQWLANETQRVPTPATRAAEGEASNYQAEIHVQVASRNNRGALHEPDERSDLPDLILYVRINDQRTLIGQASNALRLAADYPLRLRAGDSVEIRLVDRKNRYFRVQYEARTAEDWSSDEIREVPLSQFSFAFEGPGRYFFHSGYGLFFIDFRPLR